ncbi:MAG: hypothetical protein GEU28_15080 [Dehalococcoidia bacterium]|nr:hypothetical protein [Dehalococcoidia bacterium]
MATAVRTGTMQGESVQPVLPAPSWNRADDLIFVSSIFPIDAQGNVVHTGSFSPYVGESEMAAQARGVMETLKRVLAGAGTSLERMLKAEVYLKYPSDFYEFKLIWKEYFPTDPPVRTTACVGEDHIIPGVLLNLNGVALAGDSTWKREVIHVDDVPDPMDAEWIPQAIKAGPFVFPANVPATDFKTGVPVGKLPVYPYYGSDAEMQTHYILQNMEKVLSAAGSDLKQAVKCQFHETNFTNFHDVDGVWGQYTHPIPPPRSSMAMRELLVPGAVFVPNVFFIAPNGDFKKEETRKGIRWHPVDVRKVNFTPGVLAGDWFFTAGQAALPGYAKSDRDTKAEDVFVITPRSLPHYWSDIEVQTEFTMVLLGEQLEANGYTLADIADARIYLAFARRDYRGFERAWRRIFEGVGTMPSMSLIPSNDEENRGGVMVGDSLLIVEIDLIMKHRA